MVYRNSCPLLDTFLSVWNYSGLSWFAVVAFHQVVGNTGLVNSEALPPREIHGRLWKASGHHTVIHRPMQNSVSRVFCLKPPYLERSAGSLTLANSTHCKPCLSEAHRAQTVRKTILVHSLRADTGGHCTITLFNLDNCAAGQLRFFLSVHVHK